jgi:peptide/nickel transport system substrate-binding protein
MQVGEPLVRYNDQLSPVPCLATSWSTNSDGTVWTFKIRQGVKFNDGTPMTVDDVVYSYQSQADPKNKSAALSILGGLLTPEGVVKVDHETVAFHPEVPCGSFLYAVSSANFNGIVVPKNFDYSQWVHKSIGTGPFKMTSYNQSTGASFVRNPHYWGTVLPASLYFGFYPEEQPMVEGLESNGLDCISGFTPSVSPQLLNGNYRVQVVKGTAHVALSMRNDIAPFKNKYVRQAIALTLDRPATVRALLKGYAQVGNDSPFAPSFPMTNHSIPQRAQDFARAKELLAMGGAPRGFSVPLYTEINAEEPALAQIVKQVAAKIGVDITLNIMTSTAYYGQATFGQSHWLDSPMSMVGYSARTVPNVLLQAPLQTINSKTGQGAWNAAHFNNSTYDSLSKQYIAAVDLSTQRKIAGQIETLLLDETPVIYPYFKDNLTATQKDIYGMDGQTNLIIYLNKVTKG